MSTIFQIKPVPCICIEVFWDCVTVLRSFHVQNCYRTCAYVKRDASFRDRSEVDRWVLHGCCVWLFCRSRMPCHWSVSRPTSIPLDFSVPCRALYKQFDFRQWNINPLILFRSHILIYLARCVLFYTSWVINVCVVWERYCGVGESIPRQLYWRTENPTNGFCFSVQPSSWAWNRVRSVRDSSNTH